MTSGGFVTILLWWFSFYPLSTSPHYNTCKRTNNMQKQTSHFFCHIKSLLHAVQLIIWQRTSILGHDATAQSVQLTWTSDCGTKVVCLAATKSLILSWFQLSWERHREIYRNWLFPHHQTKLWLVLVTDGVDAFFVNCWHQPVIPGIFLGIWGRGAHGCLCFLISPKSI